MEQSPAVTVENWYQEEYTCYIMWVADGLFIQYSISTLHISSSQSIVKTSVYGFLCFDEHYNKHNLQ